MSLYQRGKSWYYDFYSRGERYTGCIGPVSRTVAKEVLAKKKAEVFEGRYVTRSTKGSPVFEEVAEDYLQYYRANRRPRSAQRHELAFKALTPFFGGKRLADIHPFMVERYKHMRKDAGRKEATVNRELAALKNLFTMAITWGKASQNPVTQVRLFREENGRIRVVTDEEEARLLAACSPTLRPVVITALHTGLRKSELLSLTWQDVDFQRRTITVDAAYAKNGETRSVPMTATVTTTLRALRGAEAPNAAVFVTYRGTPYRNLRKVFLDACRRAGITGLTLHDLRHTFASRLVMASVDLPTVQAFMGHKTIQMTLRYTHLAPDHKRAAIAVLDREESQQFSQQADNEDYKVTINLRKITAYNTV
jgi:integrase